MSALMTPRQASSITGASTDLIGRAALLYHMGHKLHPAVAEMYIEDIDKAFRSIAEALGYEVSKIEPPSREAAE